MIHLVGLYRYSDYRKRFNRKRGQYNLDMYHPNELKKIMDLVIKEKGEITFISCHEDIFNICGHYIAEGKLVPSQVDVMLITESGSICHPKYGDDGFLVDFPFGFFGWFAEELFNAK